MKRSFMAAANCGAAFLLAAACSSCGTGSYGAFDWDPKSIAPIRSIAPDSVSPFVLDPLDSESADEDTASEGAADGTENQADAAAQANNPLANLTAVNFQNYYIPELTGSDEEANQFFLRVAKPFASPVGDWLVRATVPLLKLPTGENDTRSGLGDTNIFATRLFDTGNPAVSFGVGPQITMPTATNNNTGSDQWALGGAMVYFNAESKRVQYGGLATYQHKTGGSDRVDENNIFALQPFGFLQLGEGNYLRAAPIWSFNVENGNHSVPIGVGIGKVIKIEDTVINFFVEPQFSIHDEGPGQPEFQVYMGVNFQFY